MEGAPLRRKEAVARLVKSLQQLAPARSSKPNAPSASRSTISADTVAAEGEAHLDRLRLSAVFSLCLLIADDELERDVLRPAGIALCDHLVRCLATIQSISACALGPLVFTPIVQDAFP